MSVLAASARWLSGQREDLTERPRLVWRHELVTGVLGAWMLIGLHLDGWAHRNLKILDTIWTPWHAVFYSGAIALMAWIVAHVWINRDLGRRGLAAVPEGYAIGLVGVAVFFVAGIGDQIWHLSLGIERDLAAFLSPTHMGLAIAILLMVSSPLRAFWSSRQSERPTFFEFLPVLLSLALVVDFLAFLFNYVVMFPSELPEIANRAFRAGFPAEVPDSLLNTFTERFRIQGIASLQMTSLFFLAPVLLTLRRWRLPLGSLTLMYVTIAVAVDAIYEMQKGWTILGAAAGGLAGDLIIRRWDPSPRNIIPYRVLAGAIPLVLWTTYFLAYAIFYGIGWAAEFWAGSIVLSAVVGVLVSLLTAPQQVPYGDRALPAGAPATPVVD